MVGSLHSGDTKDQIIDNDKHGASEKPEEKLGFPKVSELLILAGGSKIPNILLEDWSDESFYDYHGKYLEDLAGTGIYRIMENHPPCLKINGKAHSKGANIFNYPDVETDCVIEKELLFIDCYTNAIKIKEITFENVGPCLIKYEWKRIPNYENDDFPIKFAPSQERKFCIDIRSGNLLPGEIKYFSIGFKTKYTGIYKEDWELTTTPAVNANKIIFKFRAVASEKSIEQPWNDLKFFLTRLESKKTAMDILNFTLSKVFEKLPAIEGPDYVDLEDEDEVFLYLNKDIYSYDQEIINNLKEFYEMTFEEKWNLNMMDFEEKLQNASQSIKYEMERFKKNKIHLITSDMNLLQRSSYKKYNSVFEILGDTVNEIQASIEKSRQKFGLKAIPSIIQSENPPYFYFPPPKSEITLPVKEEPKATKKKAPGDSAKTADKGKGAKGKKREPIQLVPKEPLIIRQTEWAPDNQDYAHDVYNAVFEILGKGIKSIERYFDPGITFHNKSLDAVGFKL